MKNNRKHKGFTLLELMITIAIVGIVATIALWDSSDMLENNRAENYLLDLQRVISFARAKAVSTDTQMTICKGWESRLKSNQVSICHPLSANNELEQVIFMFSNDKERFPGNVIQWFEPYYGDKVFRMISPPHTNDVVIFTGDPQIIFDTSGSILTQPGTFIYCPNPDNNDNNKALQVNKSGSAFYLGDTNLKCS
ncbi:GspH/FimT family pseudopilin [Pseudoalteromonas sp. SSMSWG5]|uniref:GspH/FimT family pseudopilin n=1 Tax=Pseudoalteromonas sp. SSMSWG5 TaxID=3139396 RepID=UPI003BAA344F